MIAPYYQTANATLFHGDCLAVLPGLAAGSVASVVCSPPYAMQRAALYGGIPEAAYPAWTVAWMAEVRCVLHPQGSVLINIREHVKDGQISDYVHRTRLALRADGWIECDELIWIKPDAPPTAPNERPRRSWERILWFAPTPDPYCNPRANGKLSDRIGPLEAGGWALSRNGSEGFTTGIARCQDVVSVVIDKGNHSSHPAAYPVELAEWMLRLVTPPGGTVCDPFTGSGSTGVAALDNGYRFIGIERAAEYLPMAKARLLAAEAARGYAVPAEVARQPLQLGLAWEGVA